jgi:hypothetical protein
MSTNTDHHRGFGASLEESTADAVTGHYAPDAPDAVTRRARA